jgi:hypothetical protein
MKTTNAQNERIKRFYFSYMKEARRYSETLAQFGERVCETPEAFKTWYQNLGHENMLTTFASYGQVATPRQAELIRKLGKPKSEAVDLHALARDIARVKDGLHG